MRTYGSQKYTMADAALAYVRNHLEYDKYRILSNKVQGMHGGVWIDLGDVRGFAERWDALNK